MCLMVGDKTTFPTLTAARRKPQANLEICQYQEGRINTEYAIHHVPYAKKKIDVLIFIIFDHMDSSI